MKQFKSRSLVLKRLDLGETDRLLTILTEERGKIRALNKGARKPLSKLAGHLEPFSLANCQFQEGRNFYTITAADTIEPFRSIRQQLNRLSWATYFLEIIDALAVDEQPQPALFQLLVEALTQLVIVEAGKVRLLGAGFILRLLIELGYRPELERCVHCYRSLRPEGNRFSSRLGGILGAESHGEDRAAQPISAPAIKALRLLAGQPLSVVNRLQMPVAASREVEMIMEQFLATQTGREMRSVNFFRSVEGAYL